MSSSAHPSCLTLLQNYPVKSIAVGMMVPGPSYLLLMSSSGLILADLETYSDNQVNNFVLHILHAV